MALILEFHVMRLSFSSPFFFKVIIFLLKGAENSYLPRLGVSLFFLFCLFMQQIRIGGILKIEAKNQDNEYCTHTKTHIIGRIRKPQHSGETAVLASLPDQTIIYVFANRKSEHLRLCQKSPCANQLCSQAIKPTHIWTQIASFRRKFGGEERLRKSRSH